jgi:hypothetical protein
MAGFPIPERSRIRGEPIAPAETMTSFLARIVVGGGGVSGLNGAALEGTYSTPTAVPSSMRTRTTVVLQRTWRVPRPSSSTEWT